MKPVLVMVLLLTSFVARGMDRWAALSQIESGDNDRAVGRCGEVSRYQIRPELWNSGEPSDCIAALENAQHIMQVRLADFEHRYGRSATDFEFYVLWNAPGQVLKPSKNVRNRAERFANLCSANEPAPAATVQIFGPPPITKPAVVSPAVTPVATQNSVTPPAIVVASRVN